MKNLIFKILVCLILSSLILSSCGANEDKTEIKETVSTERVLQQSDVKETVSVEHVLQQAETKEIVMKESLENNLSESSAVSIDNEESGELSFYPPEGAEIVYGKNTVSYLVEFYNFQGLDNRMTELMENTDNIEAYYYVCIDLRNSEAKSVEGFQKGLERVGIKAEQVRDGFYGDRSAIYVAYVTEAQIGALEKGLNEDKALQGYGIILKCVAENFVEEWIAEGIFLESLTQGNIEVNYPLCKKS